MNMVRYDVSTSRRHFNQECYIRMSINGKSSISYSACRMMGIKAGDKVSFFKGDDPGDWFICKDDIGFLLFSYAGSRCLQLKFVSVCRQIFSAVGIEADSARMKISTTEQEIMGRKMHLIITSSAEMALKK